MDYGAGLARQPGRWLLQWARWEQAGDLEQGRGVGLTQVLAESSELFRKKRDKTVPGPGLSSFSSQGLKGSGRCCGFLGSW